MKPMDPGRLEASLAMADAPEDQEGRKEVLRGYTDDDYHLEASYAADAWNVLAVAEHEIILASRRYGHMDGTYRDGGEI